jgi:hypothetical protein
LRIQLCSQHWPVIRKLKVHCDNRNWKLFRKEFSALGHEFTETDERLIPVHFLSLLDKFAEPFLPFSEASSRLLLQRVNLAFAISERECMKLHAYLEDIGWTSFLYDELFSIKDRWVHVYGIVQPIYLSLYWDESKNNLDRYYVSQKRFDELKPVFVDIFETLCRISVIAAAVEGIIMSNRVVVPSKPKEMEIDEFRGIENGRKFDIIKDLVPAPSFTMMRENALRNGIGHHSAHYDVRTDSIIYRRENKKGVEAFQVSYTRFCEALVKLYVQFEQASVYVECMVARSQIQPNT